MLRLVAVTIFHWIFQEQVEFFAEKLMQFFLMKKKQKQNKTVDDFIFSVEKNLLLMADGTFKVQGSVELINYQHAESNVKIELESRRIWLTVVY